MVPSFNRILLFLVSRLLFIFFLRKWKRYTSAFFMACVIFIVYIHSERTSLVNFDIEDDLIYQQIFKEKRVSALASLKAGITVHVSMLLLFISNDPHASANAKDTIMWILVHSTAPIHFHILSDSNSVAVIDTIMTRVERRADCRFVYTTELIDHIYDQLLDHLKTNVPNLKIDAVKDHVATQMLPLVLPWHYYNQDRMIFVSNNIKFRADIVELYEHFDRFKPQQGIGLTLLQDAKFAAAFSVYRYLQPHSNLGLSPPHGWPGFNTELMLLNLKEMRQSHLFKRYLDLENQFPILTKYDFKSRNVLPQMDEWLTLVGVEKPEFFFTLPCQWNVQQIMDSDAFEYCRSDIKAMAFNS
ncbi:LARGE xylosyl- and glucuronyltransferase 1 isoform X2 [Daphnia magna]|uniref:LARGE xylosyl- and glucuronyltransferase 1 isoform X2 n=1 Tax=Daphnia magna TaxID=35525 RepID=UPI001E1BC090|nr:LARGE xylosyl- and glucuronyltransferase 1 isoform X2 [Daphnia magna]